MVALAGPSGSGKTTLVNLLPRFFDPAQRCTCWSTACRSPNTSLHDLRAQIAMVSQDVVLFNDTIAANVAYGQTPDRERVMSALAAANLADVVASHARWHRYACRRQRHAAVGRPASAARDRARDLKDAPILILDEATSALDSESERHVQSALETLMKGRTTLVIAHRLSTIERADRILVMDAGKIAEQGSHAELLRQERAVRASASDPVSAAGGVRAGRTRNFFA